MLALLDRRRSRAGGCMEYYYTTLSVTCPCMLFDTWSTIVGPASSLSSAVRS